MTTMDDIEQIPIIRVKKMRYDAFLPEKAFPNDSGFDCRVPDNIHISAGELQLVHLGFRMRIPHGWECQMRNRSGIVTNFKVMLALGVGTIDSDYRGEIMLPLYNFGDTPQLFTRGTKISQIVFKKVEPIRLIEGEVNVDTDRGEGGFGSTGLR
jgi:dUTP pyrophosphatase